MHLVTTDVQFVSAEAVDMYTYSIQCHFINGSDAHGCQVMLVSEQPGIENVTQDFTRSSTPYYLFVQEKLNVSNPVSCYQKVVGFDIEINYTIGDLVIEGNITSHVGGLCRNPESKGLCIHKVHVLFYYLHICRLLHNSYHCPVHWDYSFITTTCSCGNSFCCTISLAKTSVPTVDLLSLTILSLHFHFQEETAFLLLH